MPPPGRSGRTTRGGHGGSRGRNISSSGGGSSRKTISKQGGSSGKSISKQSSSGRRTVDRQTPSAGSRRSEAYRDGHSSRSRGRQSNGKVRDSSSLGKKETERKGPGRPALQREASNTEVLLKKASLIGKKFGVGSVKGETPTEGSPADQAIKLLGIKPKDLRKLKRKFDVADSDGSGEIEIDEFFKMMDEERTVFSMALFDMVDQDGSGTICWDEFLQVLTTYCIYTQTDILFFIFSLFDKDGSGSLDEQEFVDMCAKINANPVFPGNLQRAFENFDCNDDGLIDFDEFRILNRRYPMLLMPAFRLQDQLQRHTLGTRRWRDALIFKERFERIEAYKAANNGELPPEARKKGCFKFGK